MFKQYSKMKIKTLKYIINKKIFSHIINMYIEHII